LNITKLERGNVNFLDSVVEVPQHFQEVPP